MALFPDTSLLLYACPVKEELLWPSLPIALTPCAGYEFALYYDV